MRPLTSAVFTPSRRHARSRLGQISVSIMMNSRGRTSRMRPIDDEAQIEGKVEHLVDKRQVAPGHLLPGHRGRRDEEAKPGVALPQLRQQRPDRQDFSDRHGVDPDRFVAVEVERHREIAHPLGQADDVFPVSNRLVEQIRRHDEEKRDDEDAVDRVHAQKPT